VSKTSETVEAGSPSADEAKGPLVLVLNAGSSSLKARLLDGADRCLWKGQTDWQPIAPSAGPSSQAAPAAAVLRDWLLPAISPWSERLELVGHRVVHGGTAITGPTRLTPAVRRDLAALVPLAPSSPAMAELAGPVAPASWPVPPSRPGMAPGCAH
jgi:acetate kinase